MVREGKRGKTSVVLACVYGCGYSRKAETKKGGAEFSQVSFLGFLPHSWVHTALVAAGSACNPWYRDPDPTTDTDERRMKMQWFLSVSGCSHV